MPEDKVEAYIAQTMEMLRETGGGDEATVVLLGSAARGTMTWWSDVDLLVVTAEPITRWRVPIDLDLHVETRDQFLDRLRRGEDFQAWALRFGKVVSDQSGWWSTAQATHASCQWPSWRLKLDHVRRKRLSIASRLLEDGDEEAAREEYLAIASHVARALLLRAKVFPLSRPELPAQLRQVGCRQLADGIEKLTQGNPELEELRAIADCVEGELAQLKEELVRTEGNGG